MENQKRFMCTICGEHHRGGDGWFLVAEDSWLESLKVLHWNEILAGQPEVHCLCSAAHVREMVARWMATGRLAYPFASVSSPRQKTTQSGNKKCLVAGAKLEVQADGLIGELAVHRESLERALREHPQCLSTILEALLSALDDTPIKTEISPVQEGEFATV
jgi:hypothetical protein